MKRIVEWRCFALVLLGEISDDMYSSSFEYAKRFVQNGVDSTPIGTPITCFIVAFPTLK